MKYQLCRNPVEARTDGYVGSITTQHDSDYQNMLENCKRHNKGVREVSRKYGRVIGKLMRVRLMGRGPRVEAALKFRGYARSYDSYLPLGLAESFDVYYSIDYNATHELGREFELGMTPGQLKKYDAARNEVWKLELEGRMAKRLREYG